VPWDVQFHPELAAELNDLPAAVRVELLARAGLLARFGPTLGRPVVDTLKGSKIANLKELRFGAAGGVWRVAFACDAKRIAVLPAAADKRGRPQARFCKALIVLAERRWTILGLMEVLMGVPLAEVLARLPPDEREAVAARTTELVAREMSLRDLRKALGKTQVALADQLGIRQEQRSDMLLSTLDSYLRSMGGRLRLIAEFEGRPPVELTGLADVVETGNPPRAISAKSRAGKRRIAARARAQPE
jgi:transcriptional regulator with XRE-family HTH domain